MEKSFKEDLAEIIRDNTPAIFVVFNDRRTETVYYCNAKQIYELDNSRCMNSLTTTFTTATQYLSRVSDFDFLQIVMKFGLVYDYKDVENGHVKYGAKPLKNIVRYQSLPIKGFLNGTRIKGKEDDSLDYLRFVGFINYDEFVASLDQYGIEYQGPRTYDELANDIKYGVSFDAALSLDLKKEKEKVLARRM